MPVNLLTMGAHVVKRFEQFASSKKLKTSIIKDIFVKQMLFVNKIRL